MRVTVVATGLGHVETDSPRTVVDNTRKQVAGDGQIDYGGFDKPTVLRNSQRDDDVLAINGELEYLDIPAFLRRQAD